MTTATATDDSRRPPDFVIAGAPKCGTTTLYNYLREHPQVFMTDPKEPHFFATDLVNPHYIRDEKSYLALFDNAPEGTITGEASVHYMFSRCAVDQLLRHNPAVRIVLLLRNPVEMVGSWHAQLAFNGEEPIEDLESAWDAQAARARGERLPRNMTTSPVKLQYRSICSLGQQTARLMAKVPGEQLLILLLEDLQADPVTCQAKVTEFLGIDGWVLPTLEVVNASRRRRSAFITWLVNWSPLVNHPRVRALAPLFDRLGLHPIRWLQQLNTAPRAHAPLSPEFRRRLVDAFRDDIALLERLLERPLGHWLAT